VPAVTESLALEVLLWVVAFATPTLLWVILGPYFLKRGFKGITGAVRLGIWRLTRTPPPPLELNPAALRPDLAPRLRTLGEETRMLLVTLEPARDKAGAPGFDPGEEMRGDVFAWLQSAESALADSTTDHDGLERAAKEVRGALFSDSGLATQVDAIVRGLAGLDDQFRSQSGTPYRGGVRPPAVGLVGARDDERTDGEPATKDDQREGVLAQHDDKLRAVARRYADDETTREDVHQELRLAVWKALPNFRGDASVRTYISRVAHYCAARLGRKRPRHLPEKELIDEAPLPDEWLFEQARSDALHQAVNALPQRQRDAMRLYLEGRSTREIAKQLGISETNAGVRVSRARKALRARLVEEPEPA
jgi:RNA polymerase sigma-70 factor (ECF subfamily)